jgi:hypothetical protein
LIYKVTNCPVRALIDQVNLYKVKFRGLLKFFGYNTDPFKIEDIMKVKILLLFSAFTFFSACERADLYNFVKENSRQLKPDIKIVLSSGALFNNDVFTVSMQSRPGAVIEYTINGSDPSPGTGIVYSGSFDIAAAGNNVIKAMAYIETEESVIVSIIVTVPSGFAGSPYEVATAAQLNNIRGSYLDRHFIQTADIDLSPYSSGEGWLPIGDSTTLFSGSFNGNGLRITGLKIYRNTTSDVGLFGQISGSTLANIRLEGVNITGGIDTGGLVGRAAGSSTIISSYTTGTVTGAGQTGGLAGNLFESAIIESYSLTHVSGTGDTGGLAGFGYTGSINRCFAAGNVISTGNSTGGLIGSMGGDGSISQSFSKGSVTGVDNTGGLAGSNDNNSQIINCYATGNVSSSGVNAGGLVGSQDLLTVSPSISKSYSTGMVTGVGAQGGLLGYINAGTVTDSFWNTVTSAQPSSAGSAIGKTTVEMKTLSTFSLWDFATVWTIQEGVSYPYLRWQSTANIPY